MRPLPLQEVARLAGCTLSDPAASPTVEAVATDSRRLLTPGSLFFALAGEHTDGHRFVPDALAAGCVAAVVDARHASSLEGAGPLLLTQGGEPGEDPVLSALVRLATWWRGQVGSRVLAITGSNGKTTVKSALHRVLSGAMHTVASPGSYNSRLGVALSLLGMDGQASLAILEAGVSEPGDMSPLEAMLRPDMGLVTAIGTAHMGSFLTRERIAREKLRLFERVPPPSGEDDHWLLLPEDPLCVALAEDLACQVHLFGAETGGRHRVGVRRMATTVRLSQVVRLSFAGGEEHDIEVLDTSDAQVRNVAATASAALLLGMSPPDIAAALDGFRPPPQRLETWQTPSGVTIINDCYSADPTSTDSALRSLAQYPESSRKVFVFGGMADLGERADPEHRHVGALASRVGVDLLLSVGDAARTTARAFRQAGGRVHVCEDPLQAAQVIEPVLSHGDVVLVKGPSSLRLDGLARTLVSSSSPNRLMVDLTTVESNLRQIQRLVTPSTRLCPIVKAEAYGGDPARLCRFLERVGVGYLGVAFTDEGVALRRAGISLPVLVLSPGRGDARRLVEHRLTPALSSLPEIQEMEEAATHRIQTPPVPVHLEVDTGMGRLGLFPEQVLEAATRIHGSKALELEGLMTHFAAAEDPTEDDFTRSQLASFHRVLEALAAAGIRVRIRHAAATAAAIRFPEARLDMVRVGLGMYGVAPSGDCRKLLPLEYAIAAVSRISAIKIFPRGHTLGYGRRYRVTAPTERIAFIPCGYHDALWRDLYAGGGEVMVRGVRCPVVGTASMDSAPINISAVPEADIGDDVLLFGQWQGQVLPPEEQAARAATVPHQLLSGIGPRVWRIYQEG